MNFKMLAEGNRRMLARYCARTKKKIIKWKGARRSTISHAKCLSTVRGADKKSSDWITYGGGSCTYIDTSALVTGNFVLLIRGPVNGFTFPHSRFSLSLLGFLETRKYGLKKNEKKIKTFDIVVLCGLKSWGRFLRKTGNGVTNKLEL